MISLFDKKTHPIGLDLGTDCIKMIQFESTSAGIAIRAAAHYNFPPEIGPESSQRIDLACDAIKQMVRKNPFRGRKVVCALSDSDLVIKTVRLTLQKNSGIEQTVMEETAKKIPFDINLAQIQYLPGGIIHQGEDKLNEVIVLAAKQEDIDNQINFISSLGLEPVAIDAGPCALFRSFERLLLRTEDAEEVTFIVDIGNSSSKVVIGHGSELIFIKIINIGTRNINEAVARELGLSYGEAAKVRKRLASNNASDKMVESTKDDEMEKEIHTASWPVLTELAKEISLCMRYHAVTFRGFRPKSLKFTGGEAYFQETAEFLTRTLSIPVETGHPFKYLNTSKVDVMGNRRRPAPIWAVCVGLGLRGLLIKNKNLEPESNHEVETAA